MEIIKSNALVKKKYKEFFLPTIMLAIANSLAIVVDGIIVGNLLGDQSLAAVNLCMPVIQFFSSIAILIGIGSGICIAAARGSWNDTKADQSYTSATFFLVVIGCAALVLQVIFAPEIVKGLVGDEAMVGLTYDYYKMLIYGAPIIIFVPAFSYIIQAEGDPKFSSKVLIISNAVNLCLDFLLIKFTPLGIAGASLSSVIGYTVGLVMIVFYIRSDKFNRKINLAEPFKNLKEIANSGFPATLGSILVTFKFLFLNNIVIDVAGSAGMIIFSVCIAALTLISLVIAGAAQTMVPILGVYYGGEDYVGVKMILAQSLKVLLMLSGAMIVLFEAFPKLLFTLYGVTDSEILALGVPGLRIFCISLLGTAVTFLMLYYYSSIGKAKLANAVSIVQGFAVVVPAAYMLTKIMGLNGVWVSFTVAEIVTIAMIAVFCKGKIANLFPQDDVNASLLDFSMKQDNISETIQAISRHMDQKAVAKSVNNKICIAIEEMAVFTYTNNMEKTAHIDVSLKIKEDSFVLVFLDDGKPTDVIEIHNENKDKFKMDEIAMLMAVSNSAEYNNVIGLNKLQLKFDGAKLN